MGEELYASLTTLYNNKYILEKKIWREQLYASSTILYTYLLLASALVFGPCCKLRTVFFSRLGHKSMEKNEDP